MPSGKKQKYLKGGLCGHCVCRMVFNMSEISYLQGNKALKLNTGIELKRLRVAAYCRVSTDSEEQKNSYDSQIQYYTDYIEKKSDWIFSGIYADEASTGTISKTRNDFMRMISDSMDGKLDLIVTKSISRFARNTLDTLKYVRQLKEKQIGVLFENEGINTLTMDGELLLVILSAVAQQEVENTSANVKRGLKAKMQRGENVGFPHCFGYDYDHSTKQISINPQEAETVRYIFKLYLEGYGSMRISKELTKLGIKTRLGKEKWCDSSIKTIITNEKYVGDMLLGKTVTLDPIAKKRIYNNGEYDRYYVKDHHEGIISREEFERVQKLYEARSQKSGLTTQERYGKYHKLYPFSRTLYCGLCGAVISRKMIQPGTKYSKIAWNCSNATKNGKKHCKNSHSHNEKLIENAFVDAFKMLCVHRSEAIEELLKRLENINVAKDHSFEVHRIKKEIDTLKQKRDTVYNLRIEEQILHEDFLKKYNEMGESIEALQARLNQYNEMTEKGNEIKLRLNKLRTALSHEDIIDRFEKDVFNNLISKVVIGGVNAMGVIDPHKIAFYFKVDADEKSREEKIAEVKRNMKIDTNYEGSEIIRFSHFCNFYDFTNDGCGGRQKNIINSIEISVFFDLTKPDF